MQGFILLVPKTSLKTSLRSIDLDLRNPIFFI